MFEWFKKLFRNPANVCTHENWDERRWLDADGTLMVHWRCQDCGEVDRGHVHGNGENWPGTSRMRNGELTVKPQGSTR